VPNVVDSSLPEEIRKAIEKVINTPGLRNKRGTEIFNRFLNAPKNEIARYTLWTEFGAGPLSLHFGKFCRNVATQLGEADPGPYALTDIYAAAEGEGMLRLKPSVVEAMRG
jgi:hypothetical protein